MPLTPQDVEALPIEIEEAIGRIMRTTDRDRRSHAAVLRAAILSALSSASATEAALRAEVERLARENEHFSATNRGLVNDLEAAESREAALRGERDEACEALREMLAAIAQYRDSCGEKSIVRGKLAETRARAVLSRIREESDHA